MRLRHVLIAGSAVMVGSLLVAFISIKTLTFHASRTAEEIVAPLLDDDPQKTVINIARWTAESFDPKLDAPWYYKYDFILSHRFMPAIFRLPVGSIEILSGGGACNNVSSILQFLYATAGFEAYQHDLVAAQTGHSALSVKIDNSWVYVDAYIGVMFAEDGTLVSLERLKQLVGGGRSPESVAIKLRPDVDNMQFYNALPTIAHGMTWQPIISHIRLPLLERKLKLGEIDGETRDVGKASSKYYLTSHLDYFGPRYGRNFQFLFTVDPVSAPNGFRLTFHVTEEIDPDNLPESNIAATVDGKTITYTTSDTVTGVKIAYGNMRWTLRNIMRRKSWYDVDMITVEAL